eukprot:3079150-Pleurochrysis_carterae.AAC.1
MRRFVRSQAELAPNERRIWREKSRSRRARANCNQIFILQICNFRILAACSERLVGRLLGSVYSQHGQAGL